MKLMMIIVCIATWNVSAIAEDAGVPSPNIPELKQLNLFSGEWSAGLGNSDAKIVSQRVWMLNGYFLKHNFELTGGAIRGIIYRGYNKDEHHYTMTFLDSQGNASFLTGNWNAELKTFVFEAVDNTSPVQKYESYFPDDKTEQWTIVFDSELRNQISGVAYKNAD